MVRRVVFTCDHCKRERKNEPGWLIIHYGNGRSAFCEALTTTIQIQKWNVGLEHHSNKRHICPDCRLTFLSGIIDQLTGQYIPPVRRIKTPGDIDPQPNDLEQIIDTLEDSDAEDDPDTI